MIVGRTRTTRPWTGATRATVLLAVLVATGCVDRRFIIESNVPNSEVYIDGQDVGVAPAYASFKYYGYYNFSIVHPGYETITQRVNVGAPWYEYPPFDFVAESLLPFPIRDKRRYYFELHEIGNPRVDELINNAEALRQRGYALPIPAQPAPPKPPPAQPGPTAPSVAPPPGPTVAPPVPQAGMPTPPGAPQQWPTVQPPRPGPDAMIPSVLPP